MFRASRLHTAAFLSVICFSSISFAQTESATISGKVTDVSGAVIVGAEIQIQSLERGTTARTITNNSGIYVLSGVQAGHYNIEIQHPGFRQVNALGLTVNVQDRIVENFQLQVGSSIESVTITAEAPLVNTEDATVSTVVDRQFAENLPMNGRSFQTLIDLTPGVVLTANSGGIDTGQFSVNGQRAAANYWTVDGVSANVGSSTGLGGNGFSGAAGLSSVLGGTNSLVSVDALQEFRIQTSTFAPEFGRTPGAQISILTRSGDNQFHGSAFEYFRNDVLDANNWFNGVNLLNPTPLPKAKERQNDFGGVFGGPIRKDRLFFFFSYEGLRLRLPQTALTQVPDLSSRQTAIASMQPFLNAFPLPNGPAAVDSSGTAIPGAAEFNSSFSDPATLNDYSLRLDYKLSGKLLLFARYNYSPSSIDERGPSGAALSSLILSKINVHTGTAGATWAISNQTVDELRVNYSTTSGSGSFALDTFGGADPLTNPPFPSPYNLQNGRLLILIESINGGGGQYNEGPLVSNQQRQLNLVDSISLQRGSHNIKFGVDYRRLTPTQIPTQYNQFAVFNDVPSAAAGSLAVAEFFGNVKAAFAFNNLSAFGQDTWRATRKLTLTYGLRWDTDFSPSSTSGPPMPALTGFDLSDLSHLALAPPGTPTFKTRYANLAPRIGVAYEIGQGPAWNTVVRGGFGVFYDLATSEIANLLIGAGYPFGTPFSLTSGGTFPLSASAANLLPIEPPTVMNPGPLSGVDPNLKLPYTLQWNVGVEQELGTSQVLSATYLGSAGRRLLQTAFVPVPANPALTRANLTSNSATSDYDALQLQYRRRLSKGLQALASYAWAHSIDSASAGSAGNLVNSPASGNNGNQNRGPSDFDVRNAFSAGVTYALPAPQLGRGTKMLASGWSLNTVIQVQSAPPVSVFNSNFSQLTNGFGPDIRPDITPGIPLYLYGSQYSGGKAINNTPGAVICPDGTPSVGPFCNPPLDANGNPSRQGNLGRNALRGFGVTQVDMAIQRNFPIHESLSLQFRAEAFNLFNHPNFGAPVGDLASSQFGLSTQLLGAYLASSQTGGGPGAGAFDPLYQIGGPRSLQLSLKLTF